MFRGKQSKRIGRRSIGTGEDGDDDDVGQGIKAINFGAWIGEVLEMFGDVIEVNGSGSHDVSPGRCIGVNPPEKYCNLTSAVVPVEMAELCWPACWSERKWFSG